MAEKPEPARDPAFASVHEAAAYLRVSERTIRRAIADKRLASHHVGARVLVRYQDLDALAGANTGGG